MLKPDRNGYVPSIVSGHDECCCKLCGRNGYTDALDRHEVFGGPNRAKSKRLGLWVHLCHNRCHQGKTGVHNDAEKNAKLKAEVQQVAMEVYGWTPEEFIAEFGKNYIDTIIPIP